MKHFLFSELIFQELFPTRYLLRGPDRGTTPQEPLTLIGASAHRAGSRHCLGEERLGIKQN